MTSALRLHEMGQAGVQYSENVRSLFVDGLLCVDKYLATDKILQIQHPRFTRLKSRNVTEAARR